MFSMQSHRDTPAWHTLRAIGYKQQLLYEEEELDFPQPTFSVIDKSNDVEGHTVENITPSIKATIGDIKYQDSPSQRGGVSIVTFYENDDSNPRNWSRAKKNWVTFVICFYTFVVYCTASIITPAAQAVMERYNVSITTASLALSMYVLGCELSTALLRNDANELQTQLVPCSSHQSASFLPLAATLPTYCHSSSS